MRPSLFHLLVLFLSPSIMKPTLCFHPQATVSQAGAEGWHYLWDPGTKHAKAGPINHLLLRRSAPLLFYGHCPTRTRSAVPRRAFSVQSAMSKWNVVAQPGRTMCNRGQFRVCQSVFCVNSGPQSPSTGPKATITGRQMPQRNRHKFCSGDDCGSLLVLPSSCVIAQPPKLCTECLLMGHRLLLLRFVIITVIRETTVGGLNWAEHCRRCTCCATKRKYHQHRHDIGPTMVIFTATAPPLRSLTQSGR